MRKHRHTWNWYILHLKPHRVRPYFESYWRPWSLRINCAWLHRVKYASVRESSNRKRHFCFFWIKQSQLLLERPVTRAFRFTHHAILTAVIQAAPPCMSPPPPRAFAPSSRRLPPSPFWFVPLRVDTERLWSPRLRADRPAPLCWSAGTQCPCWWGNPPAGCKGSSTPGCWRPRVAAARAPPRSRRLTSPRSRPRQHRLFLLPPGRFLLLALRSGWRRAPALCRGGWNGAPRGKQHLPGLLQENKPANKRMIWWWGGQDGSLPGTHQHCRAALVTPDTTLPKGRQNISITLLVWF